MFLIHFHYILITCNSIVWFDIQEDLNIDVYLSAEDNYNSQTKVYYNLSQKEFSITPDNTFKEICASKQFATKNSFKELSKEETDNIKKKIRVLKPIDCDQCILYFRFLFNQYFYKVSIKANDKKNYCVEKILNDDFKVKSSRERFFFNLSDNCNLFILDSSYPNIRKTLENCIKMNSNVDKSLLSNDMAKNRAILKASEEQENPVYKLTNNEKTLFDNMLVENFKSFEILVKPCECVSSDTETDSD